MRLSLEALETLDAIAEQGSFARAAEVLHRVPSALTYTIKKLEADLGVILFDRSGKQARLTAAGERLLLDGRELLRQAELVEQRARKLAYGWEALLTIAVDDLVPIDLLFPAIAEFDSAEWGTQIQLVAESGIRAWEALAERRADLLVGVAGDPPAGQSVETRMLGTSAMVFAVPPDHALAKVAEPLTMEQIARCRAVELVSSGRPRPLPGAAPVTSPSLMMPTWAAKASAQAAGFGVGFVPEHFAAKLIASGHLLEKKVESRPPGGISYIAWRQGESTPALSWFRDRLLMEQTLTGLFQDG